MNSFHWELSARTKPNTCHVPLAAVASGVFQQEGHEPPVRRLAGLAARHLHHGVKEVVAALHLDVHFIVSDLHAIAIVES